jgi:hypothetical protein
MIWRDTTWDWKPRFALLPVCVGRECRWLVPYWQRFEGDHYSVSFTDPTDVALAKPTDAPRFTAADEGQTSEGGDRG